MTLIKSISGIRGTIGGKPGENLTPLDLVKFTSAYATWIKSKSIQPEYKVVIGRDARVSGDFVNKIVCGTMAGSGINVIDAGLATTPTVEMAVIAEKADGGMILTASHNPEQWNALKLLNNKGEFISAVDGQKILDIAENEDFIYEEIDRIGSIENKDYDDFHINEILNLNAVDVQAIKKAEFKVALDCVNSVGGIILPDLLNALGVKLTFGLYCEPNGKFPHHPEPLSENLTEISKLVKEKKMDLGFVVDPDVDRLAVVCEDGSMFGEEFTLVAVADYILKNNPGNTVSNLSSTQALKMVTENYNGKYSASAVGEVNVVAKMKETNAIIGGEGNGGVIYPELHYGRDALVGIALFLSHLAKTGLKASELRKKYPDYVISKNKIQLTPEIDVDQILEKIQTLYSDKDINTVDGVKIFFDQEWVHLRKSNTEPIIRIYSEASDKDKAERLANEVIRNIHKIIK